MINHESYFRNKKITIMGLGLLGRGVGDAVFLAECGAKLIVTDLKNEDQLKSSLSKLRKYGNIKYRLGEHKLEDFRGRDMILKAAGVPLDSPYIAEARKYKIPVEMSSSLFAKLACIPVIGITGTRGKSTVAYLVTHILNSAGFKVLLGGNVLGVSTLSYLLKAKSFDCVVLELDSWQLQGFGDSKLSPNISVFTTFLPDHMLYYKNDIKKYFLDKANIFKYQTGDNLLVVGKQSLPFIKKWGGRIRGKLVFAKTNLPRGWRINLPGKHSEYNAMLAVEVARALWIPEAKTKKALTTFVSVPGRLELIRTISGVRIYNDTNATTQDATIVALRALGGIKRTVLIMGGSDKGLPVNRLSKEISKHCKALVLLSGTGTAKLKTKNLKLKTEAYDNLSDAVKKAYSIAKPGDTILLSPAFASFGMFKNEYDRGDQFVKLVKKLK